MTLKKQNENVIKKEEVIKIFNQNFNAYVFNADVSEYDLIVHSKEVKAMTLRAFLIAVEEILKKELC